MNKVIVGTIVMMALGTVGVLLTARESTEATAAPKAAVKLVEVNTYCPDNRAGAVWYRQRTHDWQQRMGREPTGLHPKVRGQECVPGVTVAVRTWRTRAQKMRALHVKKVRAERAALRNQHPKWIALRLLGGDREQWGCLMYIVGGENMTMDPTLDYGGGHGNVYEAYGIPQANPGTKMASAGPDWRTNPETQLRWMIGYCKGRYGSVCGAAYARRTQGWY